MVEIHLVYQGELRCLAEHGPSGATLETDAPKDNHGKGENFSPTDLVATALGSCILTVMGIAARAMDIDLSGARVSVRKEMATNPIRRIGKLEVTVNIPLALEEAQKQKLIDIAHTCPVHQSLHPDVQMPIQFSWGQ